MHNTSSKAHWKKHIAAFLTSQTVSLFGSSLVQFAIIWHITLITSSGIMLTISTVCAFLPQILISLFAGVWADRYSRKHLIMIADGAIAVSTLLLALLFMAGYQQLWLMFAALAIRSAGAGVQTPAVSALIPQIVPEDKLMRINGINGSIQSLILLLSPAVSGAILSIAGIEATFFIDIGTAIIGILILAGLPIAMHQKASSPEKSSCFGDLKDGIRYVLHHDFIKTLLIFYAIFTFMITPVAFLTPLMVTRSFGSEYWYLTANEIAYSLGSTIGGVVIATWGGFKNRITTISVSCIAFGILTVVLGFTTTFFMYLAIIFAIGLFMPSMNSASMVLLQETVDEQILGRVFSLVQIVMSASVPLGMVIFGPLADMVRVEYLLIITGIIMAALGMLMKGSKRLNNNK